MSPSILIIEDNIELARSYAFAVSALPGLSMVATVHSVAEALAMLKVRPVDICLVDLGLPDGSGLEVIRAAVALDPPVKCLVVTMFGDEGNIIASIEAGAAGYVLKEELTSPVTSEVEKLLHGGSALSPMVAKLLMDRFRAGRLLAPTVSGPRVTGLGGELPSLTAGPSTQLRSGERLPLDAGPSTVRRAEEGVRLSRREQEVLEFIAKGCSYSEVGRALGISEDTVNVHLRNTYRKLSVHSKTEAVYEAARMGLLRG